jgi:hypothetical protein
MSDTSTLDNKRKQQTPDKPKEFTNFFLGIFVQLIVFGVLILIGSLALYSGKVAQTNIMPTCLSYAPYTDVIPSIQQIPVDINVVKTDKGSFSTKIEFPLEENFKTINNTLGILKNWINGSNSNVYKLYIATCLQQLISCNLTITNNINNFANSMLTETWFVLLGPYILFFTGILTSVINTFYLIILWFYNIYLLFSEKDLSNGKTTWKEGAMWGLFNWWWAAIYVFAFTILFLTVGMSMVIPITAGLTSLFCTLFPLFMKSRNSETGRNYGILETIKNILKFKLNVIMIVVSLYIISSANSNFGGYAAFVSLVACVILYFFSSVYHRYVPKTSDHVSLGLGDYVQAQKICVLTETSENQPSMIEKIEKLFGGSKNGRK